MVGICDFVGNLQLDKLVQKVSCKSVACSKGTELKISPTSAINIIQARIEGDLLVLEEWTVKD